MKALAMLAFAGAAALPAVVPAPPPPSSPGDLLGQPFAAALGRYGPPEAGGGDVGVVHWRWCDQAGGHVTLAVHADVVVHVDVRRQRGELVRAPVPATGAYPGQRVVELLARRGNPERAGGMVGKAVSPGPLTRGRVDFVPEADAVLVYGEERWLVADGYVLGPWPEPAARATGPR